MTPSSTTPRTVSSRVRPSTSALATCAIALGLALTAPALAASADPGPGTAEGSGGQTLTVSQATDLDPAGTEVTVTGTGFDESKGIYVAVAVDQGAGNRTTPVIGGFSTEGANGSSMWISSNPPSYGKDLVIPYDSGGSFEITLTIAASDNLTDCLDPASTPNGCVLATFMDHSRIDERSADVRIPLTFADGTTSASATPSDSPTSEAPTPSGTPAAEATSSDAPSTDPADSAGSGDPASTTPAPDTADAPATTPAKEGNPLVFWVWIALAGAGVIATMLIIKNTANRVREREAAETAAGTPSETGDSPAPDDHPGTPDA